MRAAAQGCTARRHKRRSRASARRSFFSNLLNTRYRVRQQLAYGGAAGGALQLAAFGFFPGISHSEFLPAVRVAFEHARERNPEQLFSEMRDPVISSDASSQSGKRSSKAASGSPVSARSGATGAMSHSQHATDASPGGVSMADAREVMNIRQASQYLGISPDTLYKYVSEETIPAFKLGNRWKFKKSILDSWMEDRSLSSESPRSRRETKQPRAIAGGD